MCSEGVGSGREEVEQGLEVRERVCGTVVSERVRERRGCLPWAAARLPLTIAREREGVREYELGQKKQEERDDDEGNGRDEVER